MIDDNVTIEVWSDIVCPFCYLGRVQLDNAVNALPEGSRVTVFSKSFQLMPHLPDDYRASAQEHVAAKYQISVEQAREMHQQLSERAAAIGIEFQFDRAVVANTARAHQLMHYASTCGMQHEVERALFRAYFTNGRDINDVDTLVEIAGSAGLDETHVRGAIERSEFADRVQADMQEAQMFGVQGVPFFVFDRKYAVSGAQGTDTLLKALHHVFAERGNETVIGSMKSRDSDSCAVDKRGV